MFTVHLFLYGTMSDNCNHWAMYEECEKNPSYMWQHCKKECEKTGSVRKTYNERCYMEKDEGIMKKNVLIDLFSRAVSDFPELEPEFVSLKPPIIVFDKFTTSEEADTFVSMGKGKYTRSTGLEINSDGSYKSVETRIRTSSNTWCQHESCLRNPIVERVTERVSNVTGIPSRNFEFAQLLYYHACKSETDSDCSFYRRHHDYIHADKHKNQGVRILTMFIYLNDVEKGGFTSFYMNHTGLSVQPKKGRAILWPNVLENDPHNADTRTEHEAHPVLKGEKYGANFWIHQYDFKTPHYKGCTQ